MDENHLNPRQRLFVQEYLMSKNATRAAINAGYSVKTARKIGSENLTKHDIAAAIEKGIKDQISELKLSGERLIAELKCIAFADITTAYTRDWHPLPLHNIPEKTRRAISLIAIKNASQGTSGTKSNRLVKIRFHDKVRALELLGKHFGVFIKKNKFSPSQNEAGVVIILPPKNIEP